MGWPLRITAVILVSATCFPQTTERGAVNSTVLKAKRVLITTMAGPDADPFQVSAADQRTMAVVEQELRKWKRYEVTRTAMDADLILAIHKARGFDLTFGGPRAEPRVSPGVNNPLPETMDSLAIFNARGFGMKGPPLWTASEAGGLNPPDIKLLKRFRKRVEEAEKRP